MSLFLSLIVALSFRIKGYKLQCKKNEACINEIKPFQGRCLSVKGWGGSGCNGLSVFWLANIANYFSGNHAGSFLAF